MDESRYYSKSRSLHLSRRLAHGRIELESPQSHFDPHILLHHSGIPNLDLE